MCANRVEVAQNNALEGRSGVNYVGNDFFADLFGVSVRRSCLFDWCGFGNGVFIGFTVNGA